MTLIFNDIVEYATQTKKEYKDALSDFIIDVTTKIGGGLPQEYFSYNELSEIENIFKKVYDANKELTNFLKKINLDY